MKLRNSVAKYLGLFALVFSLSMAAVLSMYGNAVACSAGPCYEFYEELPAECGDCEGQTGTAQWSGRVGTSSACCGFIEDCFCHP